MKDRSDQLRGPYTPHDVIMALAVEPCGFIFGGRPRGFTCLDYQADFEAHPKKYGDPLATELRENRHLCWSCAARDALSRTPFTVPERSNTVD